MATRLTMKEAFGDQFGGPTQPGHGYDAWSVRVRCFNSQTRRAALRTALVRVSESRRTNLTAEPSVPHFPAAFACRGLFSLLLAILPFDAKKQQFVQSNSRKYSPG